MPTFLYHSISHFRCEKANGTDCNNLRMDVFYANAMMNTDPYGNGACDSENYLMKDWNYQHNEPFEPNIACSYYLPPLNGCRWELELVQKQFDPIECNDNCNCECEDNVIFEEVNGSSSNTYCDLTDPPEDTTVGWCANLVGPDNLYLGLPFMAGKNVCIVFQSMSIQSHLTSLVYVNTKSPIKQVQDSLRSS